MKCKLVINAHWQFQDFMHSFFRTNTTVPRGQDFSHMLGYPAVINVQVDKEEDKGIQASMADMTSN